MLKPDLKPLTSADVKCTDRALCELQIRNWAKGLRSERA